MAEFTPGKRSGSCEEHPGGWGNPVQDYQYIWYANADESEYPEDACTPFYHAKAQIDFLQVNNEVNGAGDVNVDGEVMSNGGSHTLSNKKNLPFDMPHPNKEGWRLRHVCIEGPEIAVYFRGRVTNKKYIDLPLYWKGLVDWTSITVNLTPVGSHQDVIVKRWDDERIYLQSNGGMPIDCFYHVTGRRVDDDLIVEYEGESHEDYPGGNEGYSFNFEHNYVKNLIQETVREHLDKGS